MEFTKSDMKNLKGIAILFMLLLHLFCRKDINGLYDTFIMIRGVPLIYYLALFGDACVPIYCFASGYGLTISLGVDNRMNAIKNFERIIKLLINYWIVLVIFVLIGFISGKADLFPGSIVKFVLNFFVLSYSYNSAWWFLQTYIILVFSAPFIIKTVNRYNTIVVIIFSGTIYLFSYIQRIKHVLDLGDSVFLNTFINVLVLVGTSQLPFIIGVAFAKEKLYSKLCNKLDGFARKNLLCFVGIVALVVTHSFIESLIIAPFTGILFICFFNLMDKSVAIKKIFNFFGNHSTNLWLTHMFFYMLIFPKLIFAPKYPLLIFVWLIIICLASSYVINAIYKPIMLVFDSTLSRLKGIVTDSAVNQIVNINLHLK